MCTYFEAMFALEDIHKKTKSTNKYICTVFCCNYITLKLMKFKKKLHSRRIGRLYTFLV